MFGSCRRRSNGETGEREKRRGGSELGGGGKVRKKSDSEKKLFILYLKM